MKSPARNLAVCCLAFFAGGCSVRMGHLAREPWHVRVHPDGGPAGTSHGQAKIAYPYGVCGTLSGIKPPPPTEIDFADINIPAVIVPAGGGWEHKSFFFGLIPVGTERGGEAFFDLSIEVDGQAVYHATAYESPELTPSDSRQNTFDVFPWRQDVKHAK